MLYVPTDYTVTVYLALQHKGNEKYQKSVIVDYNNVRRCLIVTRNAIFYRLQHVQSHTCNV